MTDLTSDPQTQAYLRQEMQLSAQLKKLATQLQGDKAQEVKDKVHGYIEVGTMGNEVDRLNQAVAYTEDLKHQLIEGGATIEDMLEKDIASYEVKAD